MTHEHPQQRYEIGMVGLGVMGRNPLLNMADHGHLRRSGRHSKWSVSRHGTARPGG